MQGCLLSNMSTPLGSNTVKRTRSTVTIIIRSCQFSSYDLDWDIRSPASWWVILTKHEHTLTFRIFRHWNIDVDLWRSFCCCFRVKMKQNMLNSYEDGMTLKLFLHWWPFVRESTGHQWILLTKHQWCEPFIWIFLYVNPNKVLKKESSNWRWLIVTPWRSRDVTVMIISADNLAIFNSKRSFLLSI